MGGYRTNELPDAGRRWATHSCEQVCLLAPKVRISPYKFKREEQTLRQIRIVVPEPIRIEKGAYLRKRSTLSAKA